LKEVIPRDLGDSPMLLVLVEEQADIWNYIAHTFMGLR
jgi:hypothetical protein